MRKDENHISPTNTETAADLALRALLRPTECFSSPEEVLKNEMLDSTEKRAILASWTSDLYAVESIPALRQLPGSHAVVAVSDILAALKKLDGAEMNTASQTKEVNHALPLGHFRFRGKVMLSGV